MKYNINKLLYSLVVDDYTIKYSNEAHALTSIDDQIHHYHRLDSQKILWYYFRLEVFGTIWATFYVLVYSYYSYPISVSFYQYTRTCATRLENTNIWVDTAYPAPWFNSSYSSKIMYPPYLTNHWHFTLFNRRVVESIIFKTLNNLEDQQTHNIKLAANGIRKLLNCC